MKTAREQSKLTPQDRNQAYQGTSCEMTRGYTACLGSYATLMTITVIILSTLYHKTEGTTKGNTQIQNHLEIHSIGASNKDIDNKEDETSTCKPLDWLGIETIELLVLIFIGMAILYLTRIFGQELKKPESEHIEPEWASYDQEEPRESDEELA